MARSLPKVCPFLVTVDLKLKWPELPRGPNYPVARITPPYLTPPVAYILESDPELDVREFPART